MQAVNARQLWRWVLDCPCSSASRRLEEDAQVQLHRRMCKQDTTMKAAVYCIGAVQKKKKKRVPTKRSDRLDGASKQQLVAGLNMRT